ncbi:hypothetical protein M409DRAFT_25976 [Zasmidium cellare ATCC 36951]|uniref:Uncharacterized protein n=1 Tax=Zasmidium cellare ATCC 36951 TaxID=1080233 RepID=A0A6A6C9U5_ZASCE|nr:uncharacterized protein M409DRAFT_25976 [Zasmidium cellare ATCC 36951]KAF2163795.1 hypothetical protein M409DRAFT_25976 [Zasmidium cellare ATCC 36951]
MSTSRMPITTFIRLLCLSLFLAIANCQTSTTLVTATTTVTSSATDNGGACNDFVGACVVYGGPGGAYTTTVYAASSPRPTVVTATTTTTVTYIPAEQATTGAVSACQNYEGACVVYGTNAQGSAQYTTTVFAGASNSGQNNGNNGGAGLIGGSNGNGDGYIGPSGAASLSTPVALSLASLLIVNLGFLVWM